MDQARTARRRPARTSGYPVGWALAARPRRTRAIPRRHRDNSHSGVVSLACRVGLSPQDHIPFDHHRWRLDIELADLSDISNFGASHSRHPGRAEAHGLPTNGSARARREGWAGLIAPSAAHPGSLITCVFAADWPPAGCTPLDANTVQAIPPPPRHDHVRRRRHRAP